MYQQVWGYKVEEKLYLGVREQKRLNTTGLDGGVTFWIWPSIPRTVRRSDSFLKQIQRYSGRKITESLGNVTVRGEKRWKEQGGRKMANSLSQHV
jgi:hypothetical protein